MVGAFAAVSELFVQDLADDCGMDLEDLFVCFGEDGPDSDYDSDMIIADSNLGICDPDDGQRECLDLIALKRCLPGCARSVMMWSSWDAQPHRPCFCRRYLEMAKALDPDIEKDAAFRRANKKCAEQEKYNREIDKNQAFDRLHTDIMNDEDDVSFPDLFSALKNPLIEYISFLTRYLPQSGAAGHRQTSPATQSALIAATLPLPLYPHLLLPITHPQPPSLPFSISFFRFCFVRDDDLKSYLALPSTTSVSSRFKIFSPRIAPPHIAFLTAALLQRHSTDLIIDSNNFARLVAEIGQDFCSDLTWEVDAVLGLQTAAEDYLVQLFEVRDMSCRVVHRELLRRADA